MALSPALVKMSEYFMNDRRIKKSFHPNQISEDSLYSKRKFIRKVPLMAVKNSVKLKNKRNSARSALTLCPFDA